MGKDGICIRCSKVFLYIKKCPLESNNDISLKEIQGDYLMFKKPDSFKWGYFYWGIALGLVIHICIVYLVLPLITG
jgi:hypothetical protein